MTDRPARDDILMGMARLVSRRSTCSRAQVGAIVARDGRSLVQGYNGAPAGMPHCKHDCTCHWTQLGNGIPNHRNDCSASPTTGCVESVHAEANAIAYAARHGVVLDGTELFTTHMPCLPCAQLIINAGIMRVVYQHTYRDQRGINLLEAAGIEVMSL